MGLSRAGRPPRTPKEMVDHAVEIAMRRCTHILQGPGKEVMLDRDEVYWYQRGKLKGLIVAITELTDDTEAVEYAEAAYYDFAVKGYAPADDKDAAAWIDTVLADIDAVLVPAKEPVK